MMGSMVLSVLTIALTQRKPLGVIRNSDLGGHYASVAFGGRCQMGAWSSMGNAGSLRQPDGRKFLGRLEAKLIERNSFEPKAKACTAVFTSIESWYNPRSLHSGWAVSHL